MQMIAAANKKFASFTLDFRRRPRSPAVGCCGKRPPLSSSMCQIHKSPTRQRIAVGDNWSPSEGSRRQCAGQPHQQKCHCTPSVEEKEGNNHDGTSSSRKGRRESEGRRESNGRRESEGRREKQEEDEEAKNGSKRKSQNGRATEKSAHWQWHQSTPLVAPGKKGTTMTVGRKRRADKKENVSTDLEVSAGGETRSLDRHFITWQRGRHNGRAEQSADDASAQLGKDIGSPGVALLDASSLNPSAPQRFANFLSRRLKRTKSFPKLIRTRDNNSQRGSDHHEQLADVGGTSTALAESVATMRDILGESALRTDEAEEWGAAGRVKSMISQIPLNLHLNEANAAAPGVGFANSPPAAAATAFALRPSRSHESLLLLNTAAMQQQQQMLLKTAPCESPQEQNLLLRRPQPVHSSISPDNCCFLLDNNVYSCRTLDERSRWMNSFRRRMNPEIDRAHRVENSLAIWVLEAKGVPAKRRFFCELSLDGQLKARTSTKGMSDGICFWGESFEFGSLPPSRQLCIDLFREADPKKTASARRARGGAEREDRHTLIGLVNIPLLELAGRQPVEKWYTVSSSEPSGNNGSATNANGTADSLPSIRVKARYQSVQILPLRAYKPLREFLRLNFLPLCATFEPILGVKAKEDFASALIRVLQHERRAAEALADLAMVEVDGQENDHLLFRGNSLATKAVEAYMKLVANDFLQSVLGDFVRHLLASNLNCEVDPLRLSSPSAASLERNRNQLTKRVEEAWSRIQHSAEHFPQPLRCLFATVRRQIELSGRAELADNLLSSCIFLRFLCPAILSPSLFGLAPEYPTGVAARNLTLVAKSLQTLANFTRFGGKESYMEFMNGFVEREWRNMQCFLRKISAHSSATQFDEDRLRAIRSDIDLGKELSLLHCFLSEAWTPKLGANDTNGTSASALWDVLLAVNREGREDDEAAEDEQRSAHNNPPSDYENNSTTMHCCSGSGSCVSPTEMNKCHSKCCQMTPQQSPPFGVNAKQYQLQMNMANNSNNVLLAAPHHSFVPAPPFSSPNSCAASNHLHSADDYVLSSALAQLHGHSPQPPPPQQCRPTAPTVHVYDETPRGNNNDDNDGTPVEAHLYDEVAMDGADIPSAAVPEAHIRHQQRQQQQLMKMKVSVASSVVSPSQRAAAAASYTPPRVIQKCHQMRKAPNGGARTETVAEDEDAAAAGSDSSGAEELAFSNSSVEIFHQLQRRALAQRKKSFGASSADSSTTAQVPTGVGHFNVSQDSSGAGNGAEVDGRTVTTTTTMGVPSSGYQSLMNSSSYSSNSSSPVDTTDFATTAPPALVHHNGRAPTGIAMGSPLYSSGHSSSSSSGGPPNFAHKDIPRQNGQCRAATEEQPPMAKPRTNPSCWSMPCSSSASSLLAHPPMMAPPNNSAFVRSFAPSKFPVVGSDLCWPPPPLSAGPLQQNGTTERRHLFSSASEDILLERGTQNSEQPPQRRGLSEQVELLEARRQIETLQRENAVMRHELDRLKRQSTAGPNGNGEHRQLALEAETI